MNQNTPGNKCINILSIGNSFSNDSQRYLHRIAKADGVALNTFNLFIGGCPLSRHYRNMFSEQRTYILGVNGEETGFSVSLKEALLNRNWDVITFQQASIESTNYETYQPYLDKLVEYVRLCVPKAKIAIHQTWAYEEGSQRLNITMGYENHTGMLSDIKSAYEKAAKDTNADFIIPSGELFGALLANGTEKIHRDTVHASLGLGRYALGLLWYSVLTGNDVENNTFSDFDEEISAPHIKIAKKCVAEICKSYNA